MRLPENIRRLFRLGLVRPQVRRDLDDELEFHFEEAVTDLMRHGLTEAEAREKAQVRFGDERAYRHTLERIDEGRVKRERWTLWWDILRQSLVSLARSATERYSTNCGSILTIAMRPAYPRSFARRWSD